MFSEGLASWNLRMIWSKTVLQVLIFLSRILNAASTIEACVTLINVAKTKIFLHETHATKNHVRVEVIEIVEILAWSSQ